MAGPDPARPRSFWDLAYLDGEHLEHWQSLATPTQLLAAVESGLVEAGDTALDVGCGAGAEAVFLAGLGVSVVGVDSSAVALELARERASRQDVAVDWRLGDAARLPVADRAIDFAFDRGCFHVIPRRRRGRYAKELARVMRPGSSLLIHAAREDDEDLGLVGVSRREIDRLFPPRGFLCASFEALTMAARSGDLPAFEILLTLRG